MSRRKLEPQGADVSCMRALLIAVLMVTLTLAGCAANTETGPDSTEVADLGPYLMEGDWSQPRTPARFDILPAVRSDVIVADGVHMAIGIFLPDIEGCDWEATSLPEECELPVVMDAGPYYTDRVAIDKGRPQWVNWLVPRGYAVVQMALRGTGESGGCMAFKTPTDASDISDVATWIAEQPWSNENVGVAGRSYDGTSAWAAAASGNPYVKTIMPISGAVNAPQLYFRNGTHELRALIPHIPTYWASYALGTSGDDPTYRGAGIVANVCPEVAEAHVYGPLAAATGDASSEYWQSRDLTQAVIDNYQGSAWVIHGMVDWNVDPSQAVPFVNEMIAAGIPTRAWLGQWAHAYPDHSPEHINVRWDWADQVEQWFDFYLRDNGTQPWLGVEVEDDTYRWRQETHYPPAGNRTLLTMTREAQAEPLGGVSSAQPATFWYEAPQDGIIAGLPRVQFAFMPTTSTGGQIAAELVNERTLDRVGWGVLDLRHRNGGNTNPEVLTPGTWYDATLQFEPVDSRVLAGDVLRLVFGKNGAQDINPSPDPSRVGLDDVILDLPIVQRSTFLDIPLAEDDFRWDLYHS